MTAYTEYEPRKVWFYNRFIREGRFSRRYLFPKHAGYRWTKYFLRDMVPYCTVNEGDTVIQVSAAQELLGRGLSQSMIYSALVGSQGRVFVIEPDPVNLNGILNYIRRTKVSNVTVIGKAAWDEKGTRTFTYIIGGSTANVQSDYGRGLRRGEQKPHRIVQERETEIDTLDNIITEYEIDKVHHVNVTVNGTEYPVIRGLTKALPHIDSVSFVYQNEHTLLSPLLEHLESRGFDIVLKHAPVSMKQKQFLVGLATRKKEGVVRAMFNESYPASFEYLPERFRIKITPST